MLIELHGLPARPELKWPSKKQEVLLRAAVLLLASNLFCLDLGIRSQTWSWNSYQSHLGILVCSVLVWGYRVANAGTEKWSLVRKKLQFLVWPHEAASCVSHVKWPNLTALSNTFTTWYKRKPPARHDLSEFEMPNTSTIFKTTCSAAALSCIITLIPTCS